MEQLCNLPEDKLVFQSYVLDHLNGEITWSDLESLTKVFDTKNEKIQKDFFYSSKEEIKAILLEKSCKAKDGVNYQLSIGMIMNLDNIMIFKQFYLTYSFDDLFSGKRRYTFDNFKGTQSEHSNLISKETVGLMSSTQFDEYIRGLGGELIENRIQEKSYAVYESKIDFKNDLASRLAGYDFGKRIYVYFDETGNVENVKLTW